MASKLACDSFLTSRHIKRRYFQISKAQNELLENDSAWSENLSRGPHGMLNLPDGVLQDAKDFHARKNARILKSGHSPAPEPSLSPSAPRQPLLPSSPPRQDTDDEHEDGAASTWAQSPEEHYHPPMRQTPAQSPTKRRNRPSVLDQGFPSSSAATEGLELEPPGFLSQEMGPPVNKAASRARAADEGMPELTPPSAQLPVNTHEQTGHMPSAKRRRMTEAIRATGNGTLEASHKETATKLPALKPRAAVQGEDKDNSFTSLKSNFTQERRVQPGASGIMSDPVRPQHSSLISSLNYRIQATTGRRVVHTGSQLPGPSHAPPPAQRIPVDLSIQSATPARASLRLTQLESSRTPYVAYKAAYPDYSENIRKFISACLSVNQLRRDRLLPEFVYDDFVRAYSSDYLLYVSECSRKKAEKLLPGIQWYNKHVKDMQYTKKIIRNDNLSAILEAHAEEAHSVRRLLGDSQSTASDSGAEDSDLEMAPDPEYRQHARETEYIELEDSESGDDQASEGSSDLCIEPPGLLEAQTPQKRTPQKRTQRPTPTGSQRVVEQQETIPTAGSRGEADIVEMDVADDVSESPVKPVNSTPAATASRNERAANAQTLPVDEPFATQASSIRSPVLDETHVSENVFETPGSARAASRAESLRSLVEVPAQRMTSPAKSQKAAAVREVADGSSDDDEEDEEELAFDPPARAPPRNSPPAVDPSPVSGPAGRPGSTLASLPADKTLLSSQRVKAGEAVARRTSNVSGGATARHHSPASSAVTRSKRRVGETRAERMRNFKAFAQKRLSAGTPASTARSAK